MANDYVIMEVYTLKGETQEDALESAKTNSRNEGSVFVASDRLGGLLNPIHHADSVAAFGHIAPAVVEEAPAASEGE